MPGTNAPPTDAPRAMGSGARIVAWNTGWRLVAFGARTIGGLVAVVLVARHWGPSALGLYQFALTLTMMVQFLAAIGLTNLLSRELARRPDTLREWVEGGMFWSLVASVTVAVLLTLGVKLFHGSPQLVEVVLFAAVALILDVVARLLFCVTWAWERMGLEAAATAFQEAGFILFTVIAVQSDAGVPGVMLAYLASRGLGAAAGWAMICRWGRVLLVPRPHAGAWGPILRRTVPFALDDGLSLSYIRIDTVLLEIFKGTTAVGLYQAGTNLVLYTNILARTLNLSLYARMSKAWPDNPTRLAKLRDASLHMLGAISMPVMVGSLLVAPRLIPAIYGEEFQPAVFCYQLLVLVIPIRMLGHTLGTAITAANGQTRRTIAVGGAAALNVLLNLYFIPKWSYVGAAETTGITETALFLTYAIMLRRLVGPSRAGHAVLVPGLACVPLALAVILLVNAPLLVTIAGGAVAYCVGLLLVTMPFVPREIWLRPRAAVAALLGAS